MSGEPRPLRIALVASSLVQAGAEKQFVYTARALRKTGADARVFYLGSGGHYEPILHNQGIPISRLACPRRPFAILFRLIRAFRQFRPHIVVASQFGDIIHAAVAGRLCGAFVAGGVRSNALLDLHAHGRRSRTMLRLPHVLVANSECARKNLVSHGVDSRKVHVLGNVIDLQDFDRRIARSVSIPFTRDRIIAVAAGRMDRNKRFDRFVQALGCTRPVVPALAGLVVGRDCGERCGLEAQANALGLLPENLALPGASDDIPAILARAHMLVVTSDSEGVPNVLLEAMAARLPVITTPAGDAGEIVIAAQAGYVVDFEDVKGMAQHMVQLAQQPELRKQYGEAGRRYVEREYDFESLPRRLLATYRRGAARWNLDWPGAQTEKQTVKASDSLTAAVS
jgi:glycosyltransferase involved in cell wall biosynthesis